MNDKVLLFIHKLASIGMLLALFSGIGIAFENAYPDLTGVFLVWMLIVCAIIKAIAHILLRKLNKQKEEINEN